MLTTDSSGNQITVGPTSTRLALSDTYVCDDGEKFVGEWKAGLPWIGTRYDKDENVVSVWSNGVCTES